MNHYPSRSSDRLAASFTFPFGTAVQLRASAVGVDSTFGS
jgi:hypothetical protein